MRQASAQFIAAILADEVKVCETYTVTLATGEICYYTNHSEDLDWGNPSKRYVAVPITRTPVSSNLNMEVDRTEMSLSGISGELVEALMKYKLDSAQLVIRRLCWSEAYGEGMDIVIFTGEVNMRFNNSVLVLSCSSILNSLNVSVPRMMYQESCNHQLWDAQCKLIKSAWKMSGSVSDNATDNYSVLSADAPIAAKVAVDETYWHRGEIIITGPAGHSNCGIRRMIRYYQNGYFVVGMPFPERVLFNADPALNPTFDVYPGCPRNPELCKSRFANDAYFNGCPYIPRPEEIIL